MFCFECFTDTWFRVGHSASVGEEFVLFKIIYEFIWDKPSVIFPVILIHRSATTSKPQTDEVNYIDHGYIFPV